MKSVKQPNKSIKTPDRKTTTNTATTMAITSLMPDARQARATRAAPTTIEAHVDVGFGNNLYIRGQGAGLSWEQGLPLKNVDSGTWQWSTKAGEKVTFKLLINDAVWAQGSDITAAPGQKVEISPSF